MLHFEREPSVHHRAVGVANFDDQMARKPVTVGGPQLFAQHIGKGLGRFVLDFVHGGKVRSLLVRNDFVVIAQIEIVEGQWCAHSHHRRLRFACR